MNPLNLIPALRRWLLDRLEIESPEARNGAWWEVDFIIVLLMASAILGLAAFLA